MASTYTTNLGIEKPTAGEQDGTWGGTLNTNFDMYDQAISGIVSVTLGATGSTGSPNALAITDGALSDGRNKYVEYVDGGDLGGDAYVQLTPNDAEKVMYIKNSLSASRLLYLFQGTYNSSRDLVLANGSTAIVKFSGQGASASTAVSVSVQTSIVGITGTKVEFDTAVTDGNIAYVGGAFHDGFSDFVSDEHLASSTFATAAQGTTADAAAVSGGAEHDGFSDFVADEHIAHSAVTLTAGVGLSGGGTIAASRTFTLDLDELTTSTADGDGDFFVVVDAAGAQKKLTKANIALTGFNNDASWTADQTSIVGITGTKAQFDTALTDGNFLYTGHSHEGTAVLSTGEAGGIKFLREDGDGTSSWQQIAGGGDALVANPLSQFAATTSLQLLGVMSDETGTGALVFANSPTLVTPALGTPASGVATNLTGTASSLTAGNVTTNANLTGHVTSTGNAAILGSFTIAQLNTAISDGTIVISGGAYHDGFSDFVANEHINHASITLTAGVGLSGGGTIAANRTFTVDLNELTTETTIASGDFIVMVDITDNGSGKITFANFESILNHDALTDFVGNEHLDWTTDRGATNLHANNSANGSLALASGEVTQLSNIGATTISAADWTALSNLSGTNSGDQTSIVGITGTKAQFDTAVSDGNIAYSGAAFHDGFSDFVSGEHFLQAAITTVGTIGTGVWQGTAINQTYLVDQSGTNTGDEPDASTSVKGIVELATAAETNAGTGTFAITPSGLLNWNGNDREMDFGNTTASTSKTTGGMVLGGGLGVSTNINAGGDITAFATSDRRLKEDIYSIKSPLDKLSKLGGYSFKFIEGFNVGVKSGLQYGLIAQEVQEVMPELVSENDLGNLTIKTGGYEMTALLIEAIKELKGRVESLEGNC